MNPQEFDKEELRTAFPKGKKDIFEDFSGWLTSVIGTFHFLLAHILVLGGWVLWNTGFMGLSIFDPYPFMLLTTTISIEAIFLSIFVLMSQNRDQKMADLRSRLDFEVDFRSEQEITKMLQMLEEVQNHLGVTHDTEDADLRWMKKKLNLEQLRKEAEKVQL
jgi:uncharacterized membrane protein